MAGKGRARVGGQDESVRVTITLPKAAADEIAWLASRRRMTQAALMRQLILTGMVGGMSGRQFVGTPETPAETAARRMVQMQLDEMQAALAKELTARISAMGGELDLPAALLGKLVPEAGNQDA